LARQHPPAKKRHAVGRLPDGQSDSAPSDFAALFESNWPAIASNEVENGPAFDLIGSIEAMLQNAEKEIFGRITGRVEKELIVRTFATDIRTSESGERNPLIRRKTLRTRLRDLGIALDQIVTEGG
jgi:hypothetical protein